MSQGEAILNPSAEDGAHAANRVILDMALAVLVKAAGGTLKIPAMEADKLPNGTLAFAFGDDGALLLTYVEHSFDGEKTQVML